MARKTCPHCGASVDPNRTVCPNCRIAIQEKSPVTLYFIVGGIIVVIIVVIAVLLLLPPSQPVALPAAKITVPPTIEDESVPAQPPCTIAITGTKTPPATIQLQVMTTTCYPGDITGLRVSINGVEKGTLGSGPGSGGTFTGTSGSNNVIVAAKFSNGVESVVFQNAAL